MSRSLNTPQNSGITAPSKAPTAQEVPESSPLGSLLQEWRSSGSGRGNPLTTSVGSALEAIWANRTRSLLTMLGIVIGIAAVIGSTTLTAGIGAYINNSIQSNGATTVYVYAGSRDAQQIKDSQKLSDRDYQLLSRLPHVAASSPLVQTNGQAVFKNQSKQTKINGASADLRVISNWQMAEGSWFSAREGNGGVPVAVIGDTVRHDLFAESGTDPIGQQIQISGQTVRVVGVLAPKGGFMQDDVVFIPYKVAQTRLGKASAPGSGTTTANAPLPGFDEIDMQADDRTNVDLVQQEVTQTLQNNHHIRQNHPDDFNIRTSTQILQQSQQAVNALTILFGGVAAISLTVGGIGIMNIMLVSVTERIREIGVRISLGARRKDILYQFLVEALFLCLVGGLIGLLFGILIGWGLIQIITIALAGAITPGSSIPVIITPATLILPFAVSTAIGLIFGLYPAIRASRLDPIVALRRAK